MKKNPFVYYGKKALVFLLSVFILSVAVFYISRLAPGDPLMSYYGERVEKMSVEEKEAARDKLGLNDPIHIQYIRWVENAAKGDFGISFKYKQDVMEVIGSRIGFTLILGGIGFVLTCSLVFCVPGTKTNGWIECCVKAVRCLAASRNSGYRWY